MIATIEFDLSNEDDAENHTLMLDARQMSIAVGEVFADIRRVLKYGEPDAATAKVLEDIREKLRANLQGCRTDF
jgi:fatty acid-binding protein DegV